MLGGLTAPGGLGAAAVLTSLLVASASCAAPQAPTPRAPAPQGAAPQAAAPQAAAPPGAPALPGELAAHYPALLAADDVRAQPSDAARFAAIAAAYQRWFAAAAEQPLGARSDEDLEALFGAAERMTAYFAQARYARAMAAALTALERRGKVSPEHLIRLTRAYLQTRQLTEARGLRVRAAAIEAILGAPIKLPAIPVISSRSPKLAELPRLWSLAPGATNDAPAFVERGVDISRDAQILVVANPFCHFALAAVAALDADAELAPIFAARSTWLTPQDGFFAVDEASEWNRNHPALPIAFSARREEWPLIDDWATPTFYFLQRGRLVAKVSGWPKEGRRAELVAALHKLGLP